MDQHTIQGGIAIPPRHASGYRDQYKLQLFGPLAHVHLNTFYLTLLGSNAACKIIQYSIQFESKFCLFFNPDFIFYHSKKIIKEILVQHRIRFYLCNSDCVSPPRLWNQANYHRMELFISIQILKQMGSRLLNPIFYRNCIIFGAVSSTVQMQICCEYAFYIVGKLVHRIGSSLFTLV